MYKVDRGGWGPKRVLFTHLKAFMLLPPEIIREINSHLYFLVLLHYIIFNHLKIQISTRCYPSTFS